MPYAYQVLSKTNKTQTINIKSVFNLNKKANNLICSMNPSY